MTSTFQDKFDRIDGDIGSDYDIPCGAVSISDEAVIPVGLSGTSPEQYLPTKAKTQVLMVSDDMDSSDYIVRGVWARDLNPATGQPPLSDVSDPSFTLLARMSKDPLIVDLGEEESPFCWDQGYGLRVTCPLDGSAPIVKLIKFQPIKRAPSLSRPSSSEPDGATVLATVTLQSPDLNVDPVWLAAQSITQPVTGDIPYQGFWQDMRLRIRRQDSQVILDGYINDRHLNEPVISFTDTRDPLWGVVGRPGFDFLSAITNIQPSGTSPYSLVGDPLMRCGLFQVQTVKDFAQPVSVTPDNFYTYTQVVNRVILLVEKNGDAKYNATTSGLTKLDTYLGFVQDAESHIIRKLGAWRWLWRDSTIYLRNGIANYELPEDCGLIDLVRPGNYSGPPLRQVPMQQFRSRFGSVAGSGGPPRLYMLKGQSVNNRQEILVFPTPTVLTAPNTKKQIEVSLVSDPYITVEYYARKVRPTKPDVQIPYIPQEHMDVLIWGAAAHAMILDTDPDNTQATAGIFKSKLDDLIRAQYRDMSVNAPEVMRTPGDQLPIPVPLTRVEQLSGLGWLP
jgi:hypothetical protein